jgi:hypothetical protein
LNVYKREIEADFALGCDYEQRERSDMAMALARSCFIEHHYNDVFVTSEFIKTS